MNLQEICKETVADVDGCLGCAMVDLDTGLPLATKVVAGSLIKPEALELLSAASVEYYRGRMVWQLELAMSGGESPNSFVHEIQTTTEDTYIFMSIVHGRENMLLVLILDKAANLGLGWISMRQVLSRLANDADYGAESGGDAETARHVGNHAAGVRAGSEVRVERQRGAQRTEPVNPCSLSRTCPPATTEARAAGAKTAVGSGAGGAAADASYADGAAERAYVPSKPALGT